MRTRLAMFAAALVVCGVAGAQTLNPLRHYKAGDHATYDLDMKLETSLGEIVIDSEWVQTVQKVYDNGDADIEVKVTSSKVDVAGNQTEQTPPQPSTYRVNKFGKRISGENQPGTSSFTQLSSYFGDKVLSVGQKFSFDETDPKKPESHVKGAATLVSIQDGKAKIDMVLDSFKPGVEKPLHLVGTATVDASSSDVLGFEGTATNIPESGGNSAITISSAKFTVVRK